MVGGGLRVISYRIIKIVILAAVVETTLTAAQTPHPLTAADEQKISVILQRMTLAEKLDYIGGTGMAVRAMPSLGLPAFEMSDGPFGVRSMQDLPSTTYAAGIGLAATWDRTLASRVGTAIGRDARARGVHFMLGPGVNIYRSPRNGRNFEYYGEDPFLASAIAVSYITGMQQQGVSATIKHYLGNNSEIIRNSSDSIIDERTLREIYLPAFEAAVKEAHVGAIMDGYNLINGSHDSQSSYFNIDIARKQWGFTGVMMSDWGATHDAIAAANGGLDLEMPTGAWMNITKLEPAINSGVVAETTIDEKVRHILSTAASFDWLDTTQVKPSISYWDTENKEVALDSARESIVLLKNQGELLPLDKTKLRSILVVGPNAFPGVAAGGGSARSIPFHGISAFEGLTTALGPAVSVFYDRGLPTLSTLAQATNFVTEVDHGKPGLTAEVFFNRDLSGHAAVTTIEDHLDDDGIVLSRMALDPEGLVALSASTISTESRRFTGYYTAPSAGNYILALQCGGEGSGDRVYIDQKLVIDNWSELRARQPQMTLDLSKGPHKVVVEDWGYFKGARLRFAIAPQATIVNARAIELAKMADFVLVMPGFDPDSEGEGADRTFTLPYGQDELIDAMVSANRKTIVDVTSGGNVDSTSWIGRVPALLEGWYGGEQGGTALAEILLGVRNPSGHLPVTFERRAEDNPTFASYYPDAVSKRVTYKEGVFVGYRGYEHSNTKTLFPFGFGLSYTTFKFANLSVDGFSGGADPQVSISFDLTNTGSRPGAQVAQVYVSEDHPTLPRPERELKGFERIQLAPGETRRVKISLGPRAFAFYDVAKKKWAINRGRFTVGVGDSVESIELKGTVDLTSEADNQLLTRTLEAAP
jgi:beta-glucosidase